MEQEKRVCVTGASGFIASWLVKLLLQRGYIVHATVRSLNDPKKTEHLLAMDGAKTRLKLFEGSLLEKDSFDSAIHGCCGVFHTASPVIDSEEVVETAVRGTLNVLTSCANTPSVKRVVFTSSTAAVLYTGKPITNETVVDESWFSSPELCKGFFHAWYVLSKTLAEDAAWKFVKDKGIDMVCIAPALVIGPILQPVINWSSDYLFNLVNGSSETYRNIAVGWIHVKDVAEAHIKAFEMPSANGRYILSETVAHNSQAVEILRELYPTLKLPNKCEDETLRPTYKISKDKLNTLGIELTSMKVALKEAVEDLKEKKLISV